MDPSLLFYIFVSLSAFALIFILGESGASPWLMMVGPIVFILIIIIIAMIRATKVFQAKIDDYMNHNAAVTLYHNRDEGLFIAVNDIKREIFCLSQKNQHMIPLGDIESAEAVIVENKYQDDEDRAKYSDIIVRIHLRGNEPSICDLHLCGRTGSSSDLSVKNAETIAKKLNEIVQGSIA